MCGALGTDGAKSALELLSDTLHPTEADGRESGGDRFVVERGADLALFLCRLGNPLGGIRDVSEEPSVMLRRGTERAEMKGHNGYETR